MKKGICVFLIMIMLSGCSLKVTDKEANNVVNKTTIEESTESESDVEIDLTEYELGKNDSSGIMIVKTVTNNKVKFSFSKFNGVYSIKEIEVKEDENYQFQLQSKFEDGKITVVILDEEHSVIKRIDGTCDEKTSVDLKKGMKYYFKIIGEDARRGSVVLEF